VADEKLKTSEYRLQVSEAKSAANRRVAKASQEIADKYQGALNEARTREISLRRDRDAARSESDRLRDQAADAARRLAQASPAAVLEYASTVNELFAECVRSYQDVAAAATGHASDVRTLIEAWPVITKEPTK
jgi:Skp family chaperone for outer membrane proteins